MIKSLLHKGLNKFSDQYGYNVDYMRHILDTNLKAFFKFGLFQTMSQHMEGVPPEIYLAASLRAALHDDCGPCVQLVTNMALQAGVDPKIVSNIVSNDLDNLPAEVALVVRFTNLVMLHSPESDDLRPELVEKYGDNGLITLGFAISSARVYPALKYTLGYGKACHKIVVQDQTLAPVRDAA